MSSGSVADMMRRFREGKPTSRAERETQRSTGQIKVRVRFALWCHFKCPLRVKASWMTLFTPLFASAFLTRGSARIFSLAPLQEMWFAKSRPRPPSGEEVSFWWCSSGRAAKEGRVFRSKGPTNPNPDCFSLNNPPRACRTFSMPWSPPSAFRSRAAAPTPSAAPTPRRT